MSESSYTAFIVFLNTKAEDFRAISRQIRGEHSPEDLQQEAWLIAFEIARKLGREVDFADPSDQELVLRWLNSKFVGFGERKIRNAFKLDRDRDPNENEPTAKSVWAVAPPTSDPLIDLLEREEKTERWDIQKRFGYSQATVYTFLLIRFGGAREAAAYLVIGRATFGTRQVRAVEHAKVQPSLFDKTERLNSDFLPIPGRPRVVRPVSAISVRQLKIRLNRMSHVRYLLSSIYKRLVTLLSPNHVLARQ